MVVSYISGLETWVTNDSFFFGGGGFVLRRQCRATSGENICKTSLTGKR